MRIGVNSRVYQYSETGIPYFIKCLYGELQQDTSHEYLFFQTNDVKSLGKTATLKLPNNNLFSAFFDLILVNLLAILNQVDIFHGPANILPLWKSRSITYVLTIHDLSFMILPDKFPKLFYLYYKFIVKRSAVTADLIITDSENTKRDLVKYFGVDDRKIKTIYLGINKTYLMPPRRTKRIIKSKYFLTVNTHPNRKNTYGVLDAMALSSKLKGYTFVIAGLIKKGFLVKLQARVSELGLQNSVKLFGYATEEQLKNLYKFAVFFIYPSYYEGFGLPVVEAMACKCPVLVSNNSSLIEIVPSKIWSVNPWSPKDMARKMQRLMDLSRGERKKMITKNSNYSRKFSWKKTASEYQEGFLSLYQSPGTSRFAKKG